MTLVRVRRDSLFSGLVRRKNKPSSTGRQQIEEGSSAESSGLSHKLRQWPAPKHLMARLALAIAALLCAGTAASSSLPDPGTVLSPFDIISPDDAKTKCDNANINNAVVSLLKSKSLTKVACPFGVPVVGHKDFPTGYVLYAANVLARLLDKNQDGAVDEAAVLKGLKDYKAMAIGGISQATEEWDGSVPGSNWITFGLQVWKGPEKCCVGEANSCRGNIPYGDAVGMGDRLPQ
jgi:hypothetical protein